MDRSVQRRRFIELNLSLVLIALLGIAIAAGLFPFLFMKVPEETLIKVMGHISTLRLDAGNTDYSNVFGFEVKEYPGKSFSVKGMRLADQGLLTNWESFQTSFTLWVEKEDFEKKDSGIPVYGISTAENVYLEISGAAADARKARTLVILIELSLGLFLGWMYFLLKRRYARAAFNPDRGDFDPILLWVAEIYPFQRPAGEWLKSIRERDQVRMHELSQRLVTVAPKHLRAVQLLLKNGAQVNVHDAKGRTPLMIAASAGEVEAVGLLLKNGADPNRVDHEGNSALIMAAEKGFLGVVMRLLQGRARVRLENASGDSALTLAEKAKKSAAIMDLLKAAALKEKPGEKKG